MFVDSEIMKTSVLLLSICLKLIHCISQARFRNVNGKIVQTPTSSIICAALCARRQDSGCAGFHMKDKECQLVNGNESGTQSDVAIFFDEEWVSITLIIVILMYFDTYKLPAKSEWLNVFLIYS